MIPLIGESCLQLLLLVAVLQSIGLFGKQHALVCSATIFSTLLATISFATLVYSFAISDFTVELVAEHSHTAKPLIYQLSGTWGNHEGSILLFTWFLTLVGGVYLAYAVRAKSAFMLRVLGVQGAVVAGFAAFTLFTSNPFIRLFPPPFEGNGLNPILQDIGLALHPPMLYAGYVFFSLALSYAVAGLITQKNYKQWAKELRPFMLLAWVLLTIGIGLGSWWAYRELGWGGFWFWDPVENASLLPWLAGTALIHSLRVVEVQNTQIKWSILLSILTFALALIGFFLVRSGVLTSVHSFALDPSRGLGILLLFCIFIGFALALFAMNAPSIKQKKDYTLLSREGFLLLNNLLLMTLCFTVLLGTLYPLFMQAFNLGHISVGTPYFNNTFNPIAGLTLALCAVGSWLAWSKGKFKKTQFIAPVLSIIIALAVTRDPISVITLCGALWLLFSMLIHTPREKKILPMWLAHIGVAVVAVSITFHFLLDTQLERNVKIGESIPFHNYTIILQDVKAVEGANYIARRGHFIAQYGNVIADLYPETRYFTAEGQKTTEAALNTRWNGDLYAVIGDRNPENGEFAIRLYWRPMMSGIWLGSALMALGGALGIWQRRKR